MTPESREQTASDLVAAKGHAAQMTAFVGLDGFVDEILHVVDKRESAERYVRLATINQFAERLAAAAGKSTNVELVSQMTKVGGNGPIMANGLASFGLKVSYLGNLGYPNLHLVFSDFSKRAEVFSLAEPGYTNAVEFEDGKIMLGKHGSLKEVTWENIRTRFGQEKFARYFSNADLVGFVNWTMLNYMSDIWSSVLDEVCPGMKSPRRKLFFDLADPEKRTSADILRALDLITTFQKHFDVVLGLNEKEGCAIGEILGFPATDHAPESLLKVCKDIQERLRLDTVVIHPTACALASGPDGSAIMSGPFTAKPKLTTPTADPFNPSSALSHL